MVLTNPEIAARLDALAKPPGSMGRLEALAAELARIQQRLDPVTRPRRLILFAADHGVVADGVSAWPQAVTGAMMFCANALSYYQNTAFRLKLAAMALAGLNMLVFWIIFFEMAALYFTSTVLLRCRLATPLWAWIGFWLMVVGALVLP